MAKTSGMVGILKLDVQINKLVRLHDYINLGDIKGYETI